LILYNLLNQNINAQAAKRVFSEQVHVQRNFENEIKKSSY